MLHRLPGVVLPKLELVTEGETELYVPAASLGGRLPPTHPVFFNPAARTNRDISVAVAAVTRPATYLDALAATGARGLRIAKESSRDVRVTLLDFSEPSLAVARRSVRRNRLGGRCTVVHGESARFLASRFERQEKFDAVDVDPFGTPAPLVLAATMAASDGAMLSVTATDAAVLCGVYPAVSLRRYGALAVRSEYVHETGLRILLGFAARMGGINDIGIEPVAAHSTLHYLRVFFRVRRGAKAADGSVNPSATSRSATPAATAPKARRRSSAVRGAGPECTRPDPSGPGASSTTRSWTALPGSRRAGGGRTRRAHLSRYGTWTASHHTATPRSACAPG